MPKKEKKDHLNKPLLLISIILLLAAILIKNSSAIRPILWIISIIIFAININRNLKYSKSKIILISLIILFISLVIDGVIVYTFKRIPVFTYNIISKNNTIVYNSLGMQVWQCNKDNYDNIKVNPFYTKGYMCNANDIEVVDINTFSNLVVQNHSEYKNNYVKIKGKISKKNGINSIEMRPYNITDTQVNGYVEFANNITIKILFKDEVTEINNYDVYDEITIIGVVKNMESDSSNHTIYISDSILVSSINLKDFTITAITENTCSKEPTTIYSSNEYNVYKYCLSDIIITYPDGQYELSSAISSSKLSVTSLLDNSLKEETDEFNSKIYRFYDYSILVCNNNKDIYIGKPKMKFSNINCN